MEDIEMKKKVIGIAVVAVLIFAFATSAFAIAKEFDFSATQCYSGFTTSGFQSRASDEDWQGTYIQPRSISFSPSLPSGKSVKLQACLIGGSSVVLGPKVDATTEAGISYPGFHSLPSYNAETTNSYITLRARIYNPYGSPYNMICSGTCIFYTSGGGK